MEVKVTDVCRGHECVLRVLCGDVFLLFLFRNGFSVYVRRKYIRLRSNGYCLSCSKIFDI